jgi:hypothetical protein
MGYNSLAEMSQVSVREQGLQTGELKNLGTIPVRN